MRVPVHAVHVFVHHQYHRIVLSRSRLRLQGQVAEQRLVVSRVCMHACIMRVPAVHVPSVSQDSSQQIQAQETRTGSRAKTGGE